MKQSWSPLQELHVGTDIVEFRQTPGGRGLLLLGYFLFKSHENGFRCYEAGNGHGFRFPRSGIDA